MEEFLIKEGTRTGIRDHFGIEVLCMHIVINLHTGVHYTVVYADGAFRLDDGNPSHASHGVVFNQIRGDEVFIIKNQL